MAVMPDRLIKMPEYNITEYQLYLGMIMQFDYLDPQTLEDAMKS